MGDTTVPSGGIVRSMAVKMTSTMITSGMSTNLMKDTLVADDRTSSHERHFHRRRAMAGAPHSAIIHEQACVIPPEKN